MLDYWHLPERKRILESFKEDSRWSFKGLILKVEQADEPNDVYWENLNISLLSKFFRKSTTFIFSVGVLVVFFWIILVVHLERVIAQENERWLTCIYMFLREERILKLYKRGIGWELSAYPALLQC